MSRIDFPRIYNPANQSAEELIRNFVVRTKIFQQIYDDIRDAEMKFPEMHYIIQGIRGQGKTTMLLRIAYEIQRNEELMTRVIPVIFNEEQYNITRLYKLWETTAEYLVEVSELPDLYEKMQGLEPDDDYERRCFDLLESSLQWLGKKIILFIDNIDELFARFSDREHKRLREVFTESAEIRLIGASAVVLEFHFDYSKAFYQFFRIVELRGLTADETRTLLLQLGEYYHNDRVKQIVEKEPGRVEALRRLTSGVIRTVVLLFDIFTDETGGNAFHDLERVLDLVTPLYKHRMEKLTVQQQEIVDCIALGWDAVGAGEVAGKTRLASKVVSAQLNQLTRYRIIERIKTGTKNHLYRLQERFFNIWYLMRLGRKWDEKRVRFFVDFLQAWCDRDELVKIGRRHLESVKRGKMYDRQALYVTEALARTQIERGLQHRLITETKRYLKECGSEYKDYVSDSDWEISERADAAYNAGEYEKAIREIEKIKNKSVDDFFILGKCYAFLKNISMTEKYCLMAVEKGDTGALRRLGVLYKNEFKDIEKAEKYFLLAVEKGDIDAMWSLGVLYEDEFHDIVKAEKYYSMAAKKNDVDAMNELAWLYFRQKKNKPEALKYAKQAYQKEKDIYNSHTYAMNLLWNNEILKAYEITKDFLSTPDLLEEYPADIKLFLLLLMAKKQYHLAYKIFTENPHHLKDRFKPIYYALMYFLQYEYPNEYLKMGSEFQQTVTEIIQKIEELARDYA